MTEQRFASDAVLEAALRDLGSAIEWPVATVPGQPDLAARVATRINASPAAPAARSWWPGLGRREGRSPRLRLALVLAIVALLIAAVAVIGTVGFGWDGFRIVFGNAPVVTPSASATTGPTASASAGPPGSTLGLGFRIEAAEIASHVDFTPRYPTDPRLGAPDAIYVSAGRLSLVWGPRPGFPAAAGSNVGLLITEIPGRPHGDWVKKVVGGGTNVTEVTVEGQPGYWIDGDPHFFMVIDPDGVTVSDNHRAVGDTLVWAVSGITYRIESPLGREATIELARTFR